MVLKVKQFVLPLVALAICGLAAQTAAATTTDGPPALHVTLTPHASGDALDAIDVRVDIGAPRLKAGATVVRMPLLIVSIPTQRYDSGAIQASDAQGSIALSQEDEAPAPSGLYRRWKTARDTVGDVELRYRAVPRIVSETTRPGPLFDLRSEAGGMMGAGITFLALPDSTQTYRVTVSWDLSASPEGTRTASSLGDEAILTFDGTPEALEFAFYAVGPLKTFTNGDAGTFGMYWLSEPPFDVAQVASSLEKLHSYMADFFNDRNQIYRVFVRKQPYRSGGGTSLPQSFMFGWTSLLETTQDEMSSLLAHEMTHNWPDLEGEHPEIAWYTEGNAEYYSLGLTWRAGLIDDRQYLDLVNERARDYYTNPLQSLSNLDAGARFWTDTRAQRVPYGRGFMYLASVDAQMRTRSNGKRSLDDVVRELVQRKRDGKPYGSRHGSSSQQRGWATIPGKGTRPWLPGIASPRYLTCTHDALQPGQRRITSSTSGSTKSAWPGTIKRSVSCGRAPPQLWPDFGMATRSCRTLNCMERSAPRTRQSPLLSAARVVTRLSPTCRRASPSTVTSGRSRKDRLHKAANHNVENRASLRAMAAISAPMVLRRAMLAPEHLSQAAGRIERTWEIVETNPTISPC